MRKQPITQALLGKNRPILKKALDSILFEAKVSGDFKHAPDLMGGRPGYESLEHILGYAIRAMRANPDVAFLHEECMLKCMEGSTILVPASRRLVSDNTTAILMPPPKGVRSPDADRKLVTNNLMAILFSAYSPINPIRFSRSKELKSVLLNKLAFLNKSLDLLHNYIKMMHVLYLDSHDPDNPRIKKMWKKQGW